MRAYCHGNQSRLQPTTLPPSTLHSPPSPSPSRFSNPRRSHSVHLARVLAVSHLSTHPTRFPAYIPRDILIRENPAEKILETRSRGSPYCSPSRVDLGSLHFSSGRGRPMWDARDQRQRKRESEGGRRGSEMRRRNCHLASRTNKDRSVRSK